MSRVPTLSVAWLVAVWLLLPATARAEDKDVKATATVTDSARTALIGPFEIKKHGMTVRNAEELVALTSKAKSATDEKVQKEMEADLAKRFKVDSIDWNKQMVVGVIAREIESMKTDGKVLTITFVPFKEPLALGLPQTPKYLMLVERVEGEVKFVQKAEKKEKE